GNTVGSLTDAQEALIVGCLLGDGAMRCKTHALLEINHSVDQRAYVEWKYRSLQHLVSTPPKLRRSGPRRLACRFTTRSLPVLTAFYRQFYADGAKQIPEGLIISPLSLAVWLMDDGAKSYRAVYFNTQKFDEASQERLIKLLREQHSIDARLNRDKQYWRLRIAVGSVGRLAELVRPYLLPMFSYKLPS
ncbi:MAG: hypothetical protein HYS41_00210, partial [Candidatus Omnitrophica bacterium]|nr:hypothetical protein [Candidatus Omnitrophota bacterium]